jgi:hypothetical protein
MSFEILKSLIYNLSEISHNQTVLNDNKDYNSTVIHGIFLIGVIGNLYICGYCLKYINYKSINRSYLISITLCDLINLIINYIEAVSIISQFYANTNVTCQISNYLISATKNLSAVLLMICLINNLIRLTVFGSYTIGEFQD